MLHIVGSQQTSIRCYYSAVPLFRTTLLWLKAIFKNSSNVCKRSLMDNTRSGEYNHPPPNQSPPSTWVTCELNLCAQGHLKAEKKKKKKKNLDMCCYVLLNAHLVGQDFGKKQCALWQKEVDGEEGEELPELTMRGVGGRLPQVARELHFQVKCPAWQPRSQLGTLRFMWEVIRLYCATYENNNNNICKSAKMKCVYGGYTFHFLIIKALSSHENK